MEPPGPPPVVAWTISKEFIDPSKAVATLNVTAGAMRGKRIWWKVAHRDAPSMRAALSTWASIVLSPARYTSIDMPIHFHE